VADILTAAGVSRGTFYFYFDSKHAVLADLVRTAVAAGHDAAQPWLDRPADPDAALLAGTLAGARRWQDNAAVLRAIVENWQADPRLTELWLAQIQSFTDAAVAQIRADPRASARLAGLDVPAVAAALAWSSERLYYLAACGVPPFSDEGTLVTAMVHLWSSALYGELGRPSRSRTGGRDA
jgi:AcrR family transcriptional regulator